MSVISSIISGLQSSIESTSPTYTKLSNQLDLEKNKFKNARKGYAIQLDTGNYDNSPIEMLFSSTTFKLVVYKGYKDIVGDSNQTNALIEAQQTAIDSYKGFLTDAIYAGIIDISNFTIDSTEILETENIVVVTSTIDIRYREVAINYLLKEDGFNLLQENGDRIITSEVS